MTRRSARFGGKTDWLEIEGMQPIEGISADWNSALAPKRGESALCLPTFIHYDFENSTGSMRWGNAAQGALVVAVRGVVDFDEMASNAAESGAAGLIIVDNEARWRNSFQMTHNKVGKPLIPTVLVAQKHANLLFSGCNGAQACLVRRKSTLSNAAIASNVLKSMSPF